MKEKHLVTVVIPTYNREKVIYRAILSVLNQSYKNLEIIIVDDGGNDNTKEVIDELNSKYNSYHIQYFKTVNRGVCHARNYGISKASGDYISLLDSDDEYLENRIKNQLNNMVKSKSMFSLSKNRVLIDGKPLSYNENIKSDTSFIPISKIISGEISISASFMMFSKSISTSFDEKLPSANDLDFILKINNKTPILYVTETLNINHKTMNIERISTNPDNKINGGRQLLSNIKAKTYVLKESQENYLIEKIIEMIIKFSIYKGDKFHTRIYIKEFLSKPISIKKYFKYKFLFILSYIPYALNLLVIVAQKLWKLKLIKV